MNINKVIKCLNKKGYSVTFFQRSEEAISYLNKEITNTTVGFGDSVTLTGMNLYENLSTHNKVYDPQHLMDGLTFFDIAKKCLYTNIYLTSVNAFCETGELVNIDGTGNRIAGSLFGHEKVYFIMGINKLVSTLEDAIWRTRNVAAPQNAMRLGLKTPCAIKGDKCFNCLSKDRICNSMIIHFKKMDDIKMEIIIINETLGL